jgi:hypothetical protein
MTQIAATSPQTSAKPTSASIRLKDGARLSGSVGAAGEDTFTMTDSKAGQPRTVAYADVARVKKAGGGLSARTWVIHRGGGRGGRHRRGDGR